MSDPLVWHRLQFSFTIIYHYLFPQLTMGLALFIVVFKGWALKTGNIEATQAARFWTKIFALNFVFGVVTGFPMEFQFGTNWARFSHFSGGVIGQTLAMEGLFAFFLESTFLGLLVFGEKRLSPRTHFAVAVALFLGSWLSGYFIIVANAFMQYPVGYTVAPDGTLTLSSFWKFVLNPWALITYAHNMVASVVTASFVVAAVGAGYALVGKHAGQAKLYLRAGAVTGLVFSIAVAFPTGDQQAKWVARHQPAALAAMEGRFESGQKAPLSFIGQPNLAEQKLDNPIHFPGLLSFLAFGTFHSDVKGLDAFPQDQWPTNIELLYYSFHIMAGLGTLLILVMLVATILAFTGRLETFRPWLWVLLFSFPFPYIATTAGWMTTELGRQPWLIYGLMRTKDGASAGVHSGEVLFTLIGYCGLYFVMGVMFLILVGRQIARGPSDRGEASHG